MRVGNLGCNTLLKDETDFLLIVSLRDKPTETVLRNIASNINQKLPRNPNYDNYEVKSGVHFSGIEINRCAKMSASVTLMLTSQQNRPSLENTNSTENMSSDNLLPEDKCLEA